MANATDIDYEDLPVAVALTDLQGNLFASNQAFRTLFELGSQDVTELQVSDLTSPASHNEGTKELLRLVAGETERVSVDVPCVTSRGRTFWGRLTVRVARSDDGKPSHLIGLVNDVTELVSARDLLASEESKYRTILNNLHETVTLVDPAGSVQWTTAEPPGPHDSPEGRSVWDNIHPDDRERLRAEINRLMTDGSVEFSGECRTRMLDGTWRHTGFVVRNVLDDPDLNGVIITARSIEEQLEANRQLNDSMEIAETALHDRTAMVAAVSHELRAPLHAILGLAELLYSGDLRPDEERLARSIHREGESLRTIIDDVLDFARIDGPGITLETEPFSPASVVAEVAELFRQPAAEKGLELNVSIDPATPRTSMGDAVRVRQVLVNLASNAIKYTDQGSVSIHLSVDTSTRLISATVTDSGLGIDPARLDSLFEPFVQVRGSDRAKGTGLGLAICERLTSLMGGSLTVDSTPDCGSSFEFSFPWVDVVLGTASESAHDDDHSGSGHVLVVEDSPVNQLLAKSQLERLGYRCSIASNGEEALEMLSTDAFDLVLMDWHMPGIDGLETTRRYRATESRWDHTPIVAMTAAALQGDRESCLAAGMDDFLPKPVSIRALGTMLERWVERTEVAQDTTHVPVDGSVLRAMVADLGDASTVISVAQTFLLELPARRDTIVNGLTNHELADARRAAHTLRSTSAMLGARSLEAICRSIESIDEAHDDLDWDALLEQFTQAAEDIQNDLPNHLSTLEGAR